MSGNIQRLFNLFDDYIKKIDQRIRSEDLKNLDAAQKNINEAKTLVSSCSKLVIIYN